MVKDNFYVSSHPLVKHKLTHMRRSHTELSSQEFGRLMREMGRLLGYEVTSDLVLPTPSGTFKPENPGEDPQLSEIPALTLGPRKPAIVPVLRGGLVLAEGLQDVIPATHTGHIGMHYDPDIHSEPIVYLITLPKDEDLQDRLFVLVDPVIASGVTACRAIGILRQFGIDYDNIRFLAVVVSTNGQELIRKQHPKVKVYCASIDDRLEKNKVIPGLGSISSRLYGTS